MLIDDHINLMWSNPLAGPVAGRRALPRHVPALRCALQELAERVAVTGARPLVRGVYAALLGPSYETPAEVRMLERLGADVVGMSTVPEVIVARARGVPVLGISLISNAAAGLSPVPLDPRRGRGGGHRGTKTGSPGWCAASCGDCRTHAP
jgi:purine-nucleoside phosphorylase